MSDGSGDIAIARCTSCHSRYLPRPGPCPRCGATTVVPMTIPAVGRVLASTEVVYPPKDWSSPHRLALIGASEDIRILAVVEGELPPAGVTVRLRRVEDRYVARPTESPDGPSKGEP